MFSKKPLPPHCENLTDEQVKLVHKILKCSSHSKMDTLADTVISRGWTDVFIAVAKNPVHPYSYYKETFFERMIDAARAGVIESVVPVLAGLNPEHHANILDRALRRSDFVTARHILVSVTLPDIRARAAARMMRSSDAAHEERLIALLAPPTNIHYDGGALMKYALDNQRFAVAEALKDMGFDLALYGSDVKAYLVEEKSSHAARQWMEKNSATPAPAAPVQITPAQALVQDGQGYLRSGDCVSRIDHLPDGGSLTTVFNFATSQQIVIAHVAGQTATPVITAFSRIDNDQALQDAATAFVRQGGQPSRVYNVTMVASARSKLIEKPASLLSKPATPDSP